MAQSKKTATKAARSRKAPRAPGATPTRARARQAQDGAGAFDAAGLAKQLAKITATLRGQQRAIEELIALHQGIEPGRPSEPDGTVGAIPRIALVPPRAA